MKLVYGAGVNDIDLPVHIFVDGVRVLNPYYSTWTSMLLRCCSPISYKVSPSYKDCTVCDEWLYFSNFKRWMEEQDWEGKELDKDLLVGGNKVYSPQTCLFIPKKVNTSLTLSSAIRGECPIGCSRHKRSKKYQSYCSDGVGGRVYLGLHTTQIDAHRAWQLHKLKVLNDLNKSQEDPSVKTGIQRIINKIQCDYDNGVETVDFK